MNAWTFLLLAVVLTGAVYADHGRKNGRRRHRDYQCLDARQHQPQNPIHHDPEDGETWGFDDFGRLTLYCSSGCCGSHWGQYCCDSDRYHDSREWDDDDDDHHHHGHKRTLIIIAIVAGVLALLMLALVIGVCVIKKKARKNTRVQSRFAMPYMTGLGDVDKKQPIPVEGEKPPAFLEPYIIKGVPPPAYNIQPDMPTAPTSAENPPSYSTLSLHEAAGEPRTPSVLNVKPATPEPKV